MLCVSRQLPLAFLDWTRYDCARRRWAGGRVTLRAGSPDSTCGSRGAWRGPMGYATGSPARASWRSRWSGKGTRALMDLPPSSSEREQVVPVASGMPASAAPSSGMHRLVKVAWRSRWVSANSGMPVVSVSTRAAPEVDAAFRAETSHSRAMRPSTRGPVRPVGSALGLDGPGDDQQASGEGRREIITTRQPS